MTKITPEMMSVTLNTLRSVDFSSPRKLKDSSHQRGLLTLTALKAMPAKRMTAVSYTHLDVYKRQADDDHQRHHGDRGLEHHQQLGAAGERESVGRAEGKGGGEGEKEVIRIARLPMLVARQ